MDERKPLDTGTYVIKVDETIMQMLDDHIVMVGRCSLTL